MTSASPPEDALKRAYQQLIARRRGHSSPVQPEELLQVVQRSGSEATRLDVLSRVAMDPDAQRDLALLQAAQALAPAPSRMMIRGALSMAATLVVAVGIWRWLSPASPNAMRGDATNAVLLVSPAPSAHFATGTHLVWRRVSAASRYDVEILDAKGERLWSATTQDTVVTVPDSVNSKGPSLWHVNATLASGGVMRSAPREITSAGPPPPP